MKTKVWAHRGASAYAPENTLEAFELAVSQGADGVELDIQMTKDGSLAVIHDETIDRVCDGSGCVADFTMKELKKFRCSRLHPEFADARIPELGEVLSLIKPSKLTVNIELKTGIVRYKGIEEAAVKLVKEMGMEDRVIYSSFHHPSLLKVKRLDPDAKTGLLYSAGWIHVASYGKKLGVDALHPALYHLRSGKLLKEAKEKKLPLHVWTVNEEGAMRILAEQKIAALITNYPDVALRVVREMSRY